MHRPVRTAFPSPRRLVARLLLLAVTGLVAAGPAAAEAVRDLRFDVRLAPELTDDAQQGRLLLMLARSGEGAQDSEPRFRVGDGPSAQPVFGRNVEDWAAGATRSFTGGEAGFPVADLQALPPGRYRVQALLNRYRDFTLATGHTVSLPPDQGEGQKWNRKPGNFLSTPREIEIAATGSQRFEIVLDAAIPEIEPPADTPWIKHVRMRSELLSEFWGEDVYLGAHVLIPRGFDEHPEARYPLMVFHGHFPSDFGGFRPEPPDADLEPDYSARFDIEGYNRIQQEEAHAFYQQWISDDFPRFLVIEIQHPTPYYDDSYAVNSASQGPWGDAINHELIPFIERRFRGIGEGWARFTYGGSTGGWEAMATQVFYPDEFNGAFVACPDPIDFRAYTLVNIYEDENAYFYDSDFQTLPRPGRRDHLGHVTSTLYGMNQLERALGDNSRSGQQWDIWEATYSPQDEDGYPKRLWDKATGEIDHEVAEYWREHYDLRHILERDWATLGPKLEGKLHIYVGDMDNYYLNNAVYLTEAFLESTTDPYYGGVVDYGDRAEHCWNGDQENGNHLSRLRYNTMYLPRILERIEETAPDGADLTSWRY
ncbi:MAG: hypothetical protein V2J24_10410 [Pseudomonadales bacterium]|nr:hypothetical protein [Pseudomonadales bacterium]